MRVYQWTDEPQYQELIDIEPWDGDLEDKFVTYHWACGHSRTYMLFGSNPDVLPEGDIGDQVPCPQCQWCIDGYRGKLF